jgi:hypothetical protein
MDNVASFIVTNLVMSSPNYLIFIVGLFVCVRRWRLHPRISLLLIAGLLSLTAASLVANIGMPLVNYTVMTRGGDPAEATVAVGVVRTVVAIPYAIGFALLLYAALAERPAGQYRPPE